MKRVLKQDEPQRLHNHRQQHPRDTWEGLRNHQTVYADIRQRTLHDQGGLCAYCELDIRDNNPLQSRIEHFHPKSDNAGPTNWALEWGNMLAVCAGGSGRHDKPPYTQEPLDKNLSCDAHKNQMIQKGLLQEMCEGWILDPTKFQAWPSLFAIDKSSGKLCPDIGRCSQAPMWPQNQHPNIQTLVQHTIAMLNLNCDRLCQARLCLIWDIERNKKQCRTAGLSPEQGLGKLAQHYLRLRWPGFFTTICLCLGSAAENYLQGIRFQG